MPVTRQEPAPAIVAVLHDGFYSCGTGAGRSNRAFLETLTSMLAPGVRLLVLPIHITPDSPEYGTRWHAAMETLIRQAGGQVIPLSNGTRGKMRFGGLDQFKTACRSAAAVLSSHLQPPGGQLLIVAFDAPFYGLAPLLTPTARQHLVTVARSTAVLHDPGNQARIQWERDGLHAAVTAGGRIAAISAHMRRHLTGQYEIPAASLLDLPNGLTATDWKPASPAVQLLPASARGRFILAMGRAEPYKGFDDLIDALALLKRASAPVPHALIAAVSDGGPPSPYQRHLARKITGAGLNATLLTRFDPRLRGLLAHPALAAVIVPSRTEPFGRIPLEAFAAGAAPVVATTAGGLAELVTDGVTGCTAQPASPPSLAAALTRALECSPVERDRFRAAGRDLAVARYNHEQAVVGFCAAVAPWALNPTKPAIQAADDPNRGQRSL